MGTQDGYHWILLFYLILHAQGKESIHPIKCLHKRTINHLKSETQAVLV